MREGDLADLAFLRAKTIDLVFSAYAFGFVEDLGRVFRQVHRVLKSDAALVLSLPHPAYDLIDDNSEEPLLIRRSYFDRAPIDYAWNGIEFTDYHHTIEDLFSALLRSGYRVQQWGLRVVGPVLRHEVMQTSGRVLSPARAV